MRPGRSRSSAIRALYDVGNVDGHAYLVMEYLEGDTLASRIDRGPLPFDQVIRYGVEICDALDRAHSAGIVHRDLKPANVMLTRSGIKLLDFGLAKQSAPAVDSDAATVDEAGLTRDGAILGTLMYMAPEQLRGEPLDARADIFALGALLYEMASGRRAFRGTSKATAIAAILHDEPPPIETLVTNVPPQFAEILRRCLAKDRDQRWNCARDLAYELQHASRQAVPAATPGSSTRGWLPWAVTALMALVAVGAIVRAARPRDLREPIPVRFSFRPPANAVLAFNAIALPLALSPDGKQIAYTAWVEGRTTILLRSLDDVESREITAASGGAWPFFSADGKSIGFFAERAMKRVAVAGGPAEVIADNIRGGGASWSAGGDILFHEWGPGTPDEIERVAADGSHRAEATHSPGRWSIWPSFLPDGKHFLFSGGSNVGGEEAIFVGVLGKPSSASLIVRNGSHARYAGGAIYYVDEGTLLRQPFDLNTLHTTGDAVAIADHVQSLSVTAAAAFTVSDDGRTIAFQHAATPARLMWVDRTGNVRGQLGPEDDYRSFHISRDGQRAIVTIVDTAGGRANASLIDIRRNVVSPLTHERAGAWGAIASADGRTFVSSISSSVSGAPNLRRASTARPDSSTNLFGSTAGGPEMPTDWSADGRWILFSMDNGGSSDVFIGPSEGGTKAVPFASSRFNEREAVFSPDGKWIAFVSDESGKAEVYAMPFGAEGERIKISTAGGSEPRWSRDGRELFYIGGDGRLVSVPTTSGATLALGVPVPLFPIDCARARHIETFTQQCYDVTADGNFLVLSRRADDPSGTIVVIRQ